MHVRATIGICWLDDRIHSNLFVSLLSVGKIYSSTINARHKYHATAQSNATCIQYITTQHSRNALVHNRLHVINQNNYTHVTTGDHFYRNSEL